MVHLLVGSVGQNQKTGLGELGEARSRDAAEQQTLEEVAIKWLSTAR
jgi:hypothetical protein